MGTVVVATTHLTLPVSIYQPIQPSAIMSLNGLLLLLGSLVTVTSAARYSAFVSPPTTSAWRVSDKNFVQELSSLLHVPAPAIGGSRVKGVSLRAEKKAAAKKSTKKKTTAPAPEASGGKNNKPDVVQHVFKKADFVASVAEKTGCTKAEADDAISAVFDTLAEVRLLYRSIVCTLWDAMENTYIPVVEA
jgi:hypothetical protein